MIGGRENKYCSVQSESWSQVRGRASFKTKSGLFCSAKLARFHCQSAGQGTQEHFHISALVDGSVRIQIVRTGRYCSDQPVGVICDRIALPMVGSWEAFELVDVAAKEVAIRGKKGQINTAVFRHPPLI